MTLLKKQELKHSHVKAQQQRLKEEKSPQQLTATCMPD